VLAKTINAGANIGDGTLLLPNITIGKRAMLVAGAGVTRSVPDVSIVVGNHVCIVVFLVSPVSPVSRPEIRNKQALMGKTRQFFPLM
jgi:UDP-2-acetamido-3-amino-2,3-dideoxy-glucuronate N-acetyltransferase